MQDPFKLLDVASGIKFPDQGSNRAPEVWSLSHWTTREVPPQVILKGMYMRGIVL